MPDLIDQPTSAPTRKVAAGGISGAISVALISAANMYFPGSPILSDPSVAAALTVIISFIVAYMTRNRAE